MSNLLHEEISRAAAGGGDLERWQHVAHAISKAKGFWDDPAAYSTYGITVKAALIASEAFEFISALRNNPAQGTQEQIDELADIMLRTLCLAEALGINLNQAMQRKSYANLERPLKHGKAF